MLLHKIRTLLLMFLGVSFVHFVLQTFERIEKLLILVGIVIGEEKLTYSSSGILVKELFSADTRVLNCQVGSGSYYYACDCIAVYGTTLL